MKIKKSKVLFLFSLIFSLFYCLLNLAYAELVDTTLSRDRIALGETVTVSFNLSNVKANKMPDFSVLKNDFRILGSNRSTEFNILNGVTHSQTLLQLTLEPKKTGELLIPEIDFGNAKSQPHKLQVSEAATTIRNDQQNSVAFVQAEVNTTSPYVQSQILYTFKLFYRSQLENPSLELPQIENATLSQVDDDKSYQTTINGERFLVLEKHFAIFPQKPGKLIIPPTRFRALQLDINSGFMNDPFFRSATTEAVTLATQSFTLDVQKIPSSFKGKIWLPAKNITLTEKWSSDPNRWEVGNPITRTITIEAQGLRADQIPDLPHESIPSVNIYTDPPHRSNAMQANAILGTWQQKITYIPNQQQSLTIPAIELNWWNTQTNSNAIAKLKPFFVEVQAKMTNAGSVPANSTLAMNVPDTVKQTKTLSQENPASPIQPAKIKTDSTKPFYSSIWFWISIFLFVIWLITLGWQRKNKVAKGENLNVTKNFRSDMPLNDKSFSQACEQGDTALVQKFLLLWAKTQWQNPPRNLRKLREMISDDNFKKALADLEHALYANKMVCWKGDALLAAYKQAQKHKIHNPSILVEGELTQQRQQDPLPPLNP